jgi:hypothetical protein
LNVALATAELRPQIQVATASEPPAAIDFTIDEELFASPDTAATGEQAASAARSDATPTEAAMELGPITVAAVAPMPGDRAQPAPSDPLAALRAMSEAERIALFT